MDGTLTQKEATVAAGQSADRFFDTGYLKTDLKGRSIRAGMASMFGQGAKFVVRTGSTVVLARLLTPEDFGLIAMVAVVTNFVAMFQDMGLSMATIQRAEVNHAQISTLFCVNSAVGIGLAVLTAGLAPAVAWFYGEPRLTAVTLVSATAFIFGGLAIQHRALLKRHMRFAALAVIEVMAVSAGVAAAVVAALLGAGYWSLVFMPLASATTVAIGAWTASGWRPGWPCRCSGVRSMLAFGGNILGFDVINYFARNLDNVLVGRFCGSAVLGLYSKAYGLLMLPITQIREPLNSVAVPALSRVQDDPEKYVRYYIKLAQLLASISMPLVVFLAVCSKSVVTLVLGSQWVGTSRIFQILAVAAFVQPVAGTRSTVLITSGQSGRYLKFGLFNSAAIVLSFVIGIRWGAIGVATAYTVANYVVLFPSLWYCSRHTPVSVADFLKAIAHPTVASLSMAAVVFLVYSFINEQTHIVILCVCFVIGVAVYLLTWVLLPGGVRLLRDLRSYIVLVLRRGK
jgi:PST family polysaccharide transporter